MIPWFLHLGPEEPYLPFILPEPSGRVSGTDRKSWPLPSSDVPLDLSHLDAPERDLGVRRLAAAFLNGLGTIYGWRWFFGAQRLTLPVFTK